MTAPEACRPGGNPMADEPSYLEYINWIAVVEWRAHEYLGAWLDSTLDPDVRETLRTVVPREGEHGMTFAKRVNELGYEVRALDDARFDDAAFDEKVEIARSARSDLEKMEAFGLYRFHVPDGPDIWDEVFTDHSIDIRTAELLGRYIAEERDSVRLFSDCYERLKARSDGLVPSE
jgi:hypothetical protein